VKHRETSLFQKSSMPNALNIRCRDSLFANLRQLAERVWSFRLTVEYACPAFRSARQLLHQNSAGKCHLPIEIDRIRDKPETEMPAKELSQISE